jgi:hypothetical protein
MYFSREVEWGGTVLHIPQESQWSCVGLFKISTVGKQNKEKKVALTPHSRYKRIELKIYPVDTFVITKPVASVYFRRRKIQTQ